MAKVIAYWACHYGKEYLAWSVRSVQDAVDELHFLYTDRPSFGHDTHLPCPDQEEDLQREAHRFLTPGKPLFWHRGRWACEGNHRDTIRAIAAERSADVILVVDTDEVWEPETAEEAVRLVRERVGVGVVRARFLHLWRSMTWACSDPCMPERILKTQGASEWYLSPQRWPVFHFGYAQSEALTIYKQAIHGHKNEWRDRWMEEKFLPWTPDSSIRDVHPTCRDDFWVPQRVDPETALVIDRLMHDHPYHGLGLIR